MNSRNGFAVLTAFLTLGCHTIYMGRYALPPITSDGAPTEGVLRVEVERAILPLGFVRSSDSGGELFQLGLVNYYNAAPLVSERGERWERARLGVALDLRAGWVVVTDPDHDYETQFVRSLKASIEDRLRLRYPSAQVEFVRQLDLFQ